MIAIIIVTTTNAPGTIALSGTSTAASCSSIRRGCAGLRITRTFSPCRRLPICAQVRWDHLQARNIGLVCRLSKGWQ
jgi:hypothetical protein